MQTILGSGGSIGIELARALPEYTRSIRLVSRNPKAVNATDELFPADLLDAAAVDRAVAGSEIVYRTAGFAYSAKVWSATWPKVMENVILAARRHGSSVVFFDNMYMYAPEEVPHMTEASRVAPVSRKGKVRAEIAAMLMDAAGRGEVKALIARSADFYGPGIGNSVMGISVVDRLRAGKKANWFHSTRHHHSFTFTPDAGKATAILGNDPRAYGQVWHLPTAADPPTGAGWVEAIAGELGAPARVQVAGKGLVRIMGAFVPVMREFSELMYQWDRDYIFDSSRFEKTYGFAPTPYSEGIKAVANALPR